MLVGGRKLSHVIKKNENDYHLHQDHFFILFCQTDLWNNSPLLHSAEAFPPYLKLSENPREQSKIVKNTQYQVRKTKKDCENFLAESNGRNAIDQLLSLFRMKYFELQRIPFYLKIL